MQGHRAEKVSMVCCKNKAQVSLCQMLKNSYFYRKVQAINMLTWYQCFQSHMYRNLWIYVTGLLSVSALHRLEGLKSSSWDFHKAMRSSKKQINK